MCQHFYNILDSKIGDTFSIDSCSEMHVALTSPTMPLSITQQTTDTCILTKERVTGHAAREKLQLQVRCKAPCTLKCTSGTNLNSCANHYYKVCEYISQQLTLKPVHATSVDSIHFSASPHCQRSSNVLGQNTNCSALQSCTSKLATV